MIKSYFLIAIRNLFRNKSVSFINIFGLALGTACCLYILLYVKDEYNYDEYHNDVEHIYRVTSILGAEDQPHYMATCSPPIVGMIKQDFPEVEESTRFVGMFTGSKQVFRHDGKVLYESDGAYADSTFFNIFTYEFIYGNAQQALAAPFNIVLSEQTAQKFFGEEDPVGKNLEMDTGDGSQKLTVTGVVRSPGKSHIQANFFLSMNSGGIGAYAMSSNEWAGNNFTNSYVKLRPNTTAAALEKKLPEFLQKYGNEQFQRSQTKKKLVLQPITAIHTTTLYDAEPSKAVSTTLLSILLAIAGLIQLIACINFMNLSTARASQRAREIGIRKVVGAQRQTLIVQFLGESLLVAFLAMFLAIPMVNIGLPFLNQMTGIEISSNFLMNQQVWMGIIILALLTGLLAGSYPAFYLSGFRPLQVLKSKVVSLGGNVSLRQGLVVFQFVLAVSLIISVIVINAQLKYIQDQDLGYDPGQKIVVPFRTSDAIKFANSYREEIRQLPEVQSVSRANNYPSQFVFNDMGFYKQSKSMKEAVNTQFMQVDEFFMESLGIDLIGGRNFKQTDTIGRVIANESMLQELGIATDQAVGQHIYSDLEDQVLNLEIVGVMKDFNFNSLYNKVTPFLLLYSSDADNAQMIINAQTEDFTHLIRQLQSIWESQIASVPFEYSFIDEAVQQQYQADRRLSHIINSFTFLTILISCLGLLGLAIFTTERRTKEIGIRKVLGASVLNITTMISREFVKLAVIALIVSIPLAWWVMQQWLADFAYQVAIQWWMFALAGLLTIAIAFLTVSFQAIKAALANPVKSLRSE